MATRDHRYRLSLDWTGNLGSGTSGYCDYARDHAIGGDGKPPIPGSSDPAFRGDATRWNPEELLVASLSACHQLWFLHLASDAGLCVTAYHDDAEGLMTEGQDGAGQFTEVVLQPRVTLAVCHDAADLDRANDLHEKAHALCFIARSVKFPVHCKPRASLATQ